MEREGSMCKEIESGAEFPRVAPPYDIPSYLEFSLMDREENDPDDVAEVLDICSNKEE